MKIILDNVEKNINVKEYASFQFLLWELEKTIENKGRIITSMKIDGKNLDKTSEITLGEISLVEICSKSPIMVLNSALHELDMYLDKFFEAITEMVFNFQYGDRLQGIKTLVEGIDGLEWIFQILENSEELLSLHEAKLSNIFTKADKTMIVLTKAIDNHNYAEICILLEFDLYFVLSSIKEIVPALVEKTNNFEKLEMIIN